MAVDSSDARFYTFGSRRDALDPHPDRKAEWFATHTRDAHMPHVGSNLERLRILDVGCNRGFLLAALVRLGGRDLHGIDLSGAEIAHARRLVPEATPEVAGAVEFASTQPACFDIVISKTVLEHVPKADVLAFLGALRRVTKPGGLVLVEVPNMDWLFASHERYMDFTHEAGFTRESLLQALGQVFADVKIVPLATVNGSVLGRMRTRFARRALGTLLRWAEPDRASNPIWARSLLGVAR